MAFSVRSPSFNLVDIGTHSLALYTNGPEPTTSKEPVVLFISGHSWAGVLINEFIALTGDGPHIAGVVLVNANHETMPQVLNGNDPDLAVISTGVDPYSSRGIDIEHKLTQEEWDKFQEDEAIGKHMFMAEKEECQYAPSFDTLCEKELDKNQPLLGDKPVYVIGGMRSKDWTRLYGAGVKKGNGTEEQRDRVRELIRTADEKSECLMKLHLKLSTKSNIVLARESGHFVQLTQPESVVDGVEWVLENYIS